MIIAKTNGDAFCYAKTGTGQELARNWPAPASAEGIVWQHTKAPELRGRSAGQFSAIVLFPEAHSMDVVFRWRQTLGNVSSGGSFWETLDRILSFLYYPQKLLIGDGLMLSLDLYGVFQTKSECEMKLEQKRTKKPVGGLKWALEAIV